MAADQLIKRNFWAVLLLPIGVLAYVSAKTVTSFAGALFLTPDEKQLTTPPLVARTAPTVPSSSRVTSADAILSRNPFDHTTGALNAPPPTEAVPAASLDTSDPMSAPQCDGVKVLVITASSDPDWSFAAMTSGSDPKSQLRRRGGEIAGKKVHFVGWDRVWLESGPTLCQVGLWRPASEAKPIATMAPPTAAPASTGGAPGVDPSISKGIVRVSANEFNVDRGVVDKILENQADLMRQARIVPEQENGKVVGIRLFGVRPDTLLGTLGMENGDRLQTINGFDIASPEKALEAYARLRTADKLNITLNRRGQNMNLDYNIK
jgi:general secretion pathway protein C